MKTKVTIKNSINLQDVDFSYTALNSKSYPLGSIQKTDTIEWYFVTGELAASITVLTIAKWMEGNNIHVEEDQEADEVNCIEYLDKNWETVTQLYFIETYARTEVADAA